MIRKIFAFTLSRFAAVLGYKLIPANSRMLQKPALDLVIEMLRADGVTSPVVFDVGANIGQSIERLLAKIPQASIHAFEPGLMAFKTLNEKWGGNEHVSMLQIALGASDGEAVLNENQESTMSSFYELGQAGWGKVEASHTVKMSTLDKYCEDRQLHRLDLLKSDTQGFDLSVLQGAEKMILKKAIRIICLELIFCEIYVGMPPYHEVLRWLSERGYHLVAITDSHYQDGRLGWADAIFSPTNSQL